MLRYQRAYVTGALLVVFILSFYPIAVSQVQNFSGEECLEQFDT
jgi:hypothetical protein